MDSSDSHSVVDLWDFVLTFVSNIGLVGLVKQDLLGDGTELEFVGYQQWFEVCFRAV
jgi:hypothetical protein